MAMLLQSPLNKEEGFLIISFNLKLDEQLKMITIFYTKDRNTNTFYS
jgi:hypothetical protein